MEMNGSPVPEQDGHNSQLSGDGISTTTSRNDVHLKLLIPNAAVGAVVGRGGESVSQLQQQTGTRIKMSRPNEFFPGTTDRVCLISGTVEAVAHSYELIVRKICERPADTNSQQTNANDMEIGSPASRRNGERTRQVKLLVTNSTAGMVIGKGGSNIKEIKEESGAVIQISQKSPSNPGSQSGSHAERLISISGEFEELDRAVRLILRKIESDPQSSASASISYADANANLNANSGVGIRSHQQSHTHQQQFGESAVSPRFVSSRRGENGATDRGNPQFDSRLRNANAMQLGFAGHLSGEQQQQAEMAYNTQQRPSANLEQIAALLRSSGYPEAAVGEITSAMGTLIAYGMLNINVDALSVGGSLQYSLLGGLQIQAVGGGFQQGFPQAAYPHASLMPAAHNSAGQTGANANSSYLSPATPTPSYVNAGAPGQSSDDALSLSSASFSVPVQSGALVDVDPNGNPSSGYPTMYDPTIVPISVYEMLSQGGLPLGGLNALNQAGLLGPGVSLTGVQSMNLAEALGTGSMQHRFADDGSLNGGTLVQRELKVHDSLVGVIFGVGGKWIADLQAQTGASIQVSKKGAYAQASQDRLVTVKGSLPSVTQAVHMIMQKLNSEEERRATRRQLPRGDAQSTDSDYATTA